MTKFLLAAWLALVSLIGSGTCLGETLNIVFIPKSSDQEFWKFMRRGADRAIEENSSLALIWRGPAYNDDAESQISILKAYSRPGVDAIIIVPTDRARLVEPIRHAAELGIKIIVVDSAVDGDWYERFITTDNYAAGQLAARVLSARLDGRGRVAVLRTVPGSASTDDRAQGFIDDLKRHSPKIKVVSDTWGGGSTGKLMNSALAVLDEAGPLDGIFTVNESASDGMLRALRSKKLAGKLRLIGFDATDFLLAGLGQKEVDGLIVQDPRQMGYLAIKAAVSAIRGEAVANKIIHTGTTMVTAENVGQPDIRSLLVP